jgi:hypothetical protein
MSLFKINGYWKDDKTEFNDYIVKSTHDVGKDDDSIFYYGLSKKDIQNAIKEGENNALEFVITSYEKIS